MKTIIQPRHQRICRPARGFGIVTAVFLLVVLAGLGAALVNLTTVQHTSSSLDIQGARAYQAARAGIEWGLYRQLRNNNCVAASSFVVPDYGFTVTVQCILTIGPGALQRYQVTAVACNQPVNGACTATAASNSTDYVRRRLQAEF